MTTRRRSFMATRMAKMRGIDRSEKELLVSIGQIVDSAINNRTPTNPTGVVQKLGRSDPRLPSVRNLQVNAGVRSVKITWNPVDGTILDCYNITITNMGTGETFDRTSYTSTFTFKGESGDYKAEIRAVGRNKTASPEQVVLFTIPDSVMILEGTKNGTSTESPFVSEVVLTPADYKVFAWASFVLNSFASPVENHSPIVQLRYGDTLAASTLIQSIEMFPESETATNLNDLDYGGIIRPDATPTRAGNFETTHSVMFAPFDVPDAIANQSTRFWVNVTNRDAEADVISCSIVLWVGSGGRGELGVTPTAGVVNPRSIEQSGVSTLYLGGIKDQVAGDFEDTFTLAFWMKPSDLEDGLGDRALFIFDPISGTINHFPNQIILAYNDDAPGYEITASIASSNGSTASGIDFFTMTVHRPPVANGSSDIWTNGNNNWNLFIVVWDRFETGQDRLKMYMNGTRITTTGPVTVTSNGAGLPDIDRDITVPLTGFGSVNAYNISYASVANSSAKARFNSAGVWNSALTAAEILTLYNGGHGATVDWRTNSGDYVASANLSHYYLYGFDTTDSTTIANDYGNAVTLINMNLSYDLAFFGPPNLYSVMTTSDVVTDAPV